MSSSTWPGPRTSTSSTAATPSRPPTSTPPWRSPGSTVESGDVVLVRTGQMTHLRHAAGASPPVGPPSRVPNMLRFARRDHVHGALVGVVHGHGGVVPRPRRRRGGHRHHGARGHPVRGRRGLPARAPAAPGGDGDDPGPELDARRARRRLRRRRPVHLPPRRHARCRSPTGWARRSTRSPSSSGSPSSPAEQPRGSPAQPLTSGAAAGGSGDRPRGGAGPGRL